MFEIVLVHALNIILYNLHQSEANTVVAYYSTKIFCALNSYLTSLYYHGTGLQVWLMLGHFMYLLNWGQYLTHSYTKILFKILHCYTFIGTIRCTDRSKRLRENKTSRITKSDLSRMVPLLHLFLCTQNFVSVRSFMDSYFTVSLYNLRFPIRINDFW